MTAASGHHDHAPQLTCVVAWHAHECLWWGVCGLQSRAGDPPRGFPEDLGAPKHSPDDHATQGLAGGSSSDPDEDGISEPDESSLGTSPDLDESSLGRTSTGLDSADADAGAGRWSSHPGDEEYGPSQTSHRRLDASALAAPAESQALEPSPPEVTYSHRQREFMEEFSSATAKKRRWATSLSGKA